VKFTEDDDCPYEAHRANSKGAWPFNHTQAFNDDVNILLHSTGQTATSEALDHDNADILVDAGVSGFPAVLDSCLDHDNVDILAVRKF